LNRNDLLSNRENGNLLVYRNDFERYQVSKEDVNRAICGLTYIQNVFQGNNKTFFIGVVAPDKLTAYQPFIKNFDREAINWMDDIAQHPKLNVPNLNRALREGIARGTRDVYLPNDTHWGYTGQKIVSETLYDYLLEQKIVTQDGKRDSSPATP